MLKIMYNEKLVGLGFGEQTIVFFLSVKYTVVICFCYV